MLQTISPEKRQMNKRGLGVLRQGMLLAVVMGLAGCGLMRDFGRAITERTRAVSANVVAVRVLERSSEGVKLEALVQVENPNEEPVPLVEVSYIVRLGDASSPPITMPPSRSVPARASATMSLPASIPLGKDERAGTEYAITGTLRYERPGQVRQFLTESGVPLPAVEIRSEGTVR